MECYAKLSEEHQKKWKDFCEKLSKLNLTKDMTTSLNYIYSQLEDSVTLKITYCNVIFDVMNTSNYSDNFKECIEIIRLMAPLVIGKARVINYWTIYDAACNGYTEIVKILVPSTDNPNAP